MEAGWYAAVIRMKIKRRQFHVRVGTNLTLRIQSRILLLPPLLSTPDEARGISSSPEMFCNQLTEHTVSILLYVDSTFQLLVRESAEFIRMHSCVFMYVFMLVCVLVHTCVHAYLWVQLCMYEYMGAAGDWSVGNRVWTMGDGDGSAVRGWTGGGWGEQAQGGGWRRCILVWAITVF